MREKVEPIPFTLTDEHKEYLDPRLLKGADPEALAHFIIRVWEPVDYTRVPGSAEGFVNAVVEYAHGREARQARDAASDYSNSPAPTPTWKRRTKALLMWFAFMYRNEPATTRWLAIWMNIGGLPAFIGIILAGRAQSNSWIELGCLLGAIIGFILWGLFTQYVNDRPGRR
ncbi:hypothetical protein [Tsukamurella pseudospumae]|uniref:Uncharacterized protein n=1 Tax=Tsukamurella pseudospumae TaxID=239498 RepID=A0A138AMC8_9ACTN|nr:hypothetical protein [Tsukamurella pseudospumae]KXP11623.1 hypothetical protein AXK60_24745 [Tsukamurella pseudospumae]